MQGKEEEYEVWRLCESKGVQNSLPEILENEELISVILYFLAGPVAMGQGIMVLI